jgi:hypothetical protein
VLPFDQGKRDLVELTPRLNFWPIRYLMIFRYLIAAGTLFTTKAHSQHTTGDDHRYFRIGFFEVHVKNDDLSDHWITLQNLQG